MPGRVVDPAHQRQARPAVLEPGMPRAVDLDEQARLGHPVPAAAMAGCPAHPRARDSRRPAGSGGPMTRLRSDALALGEELGEVRSR